MVGTACQTIEWVGIHSMELKEGLNANYDFKLKAPRIHSMELKEHTHKTLAGRTRGNPFNGIERTRQPTICTFTGRSRRIHSMKLKEHLGEPLAGALGLWVESIRWN